MSKTFIETLREIRQGQSVEDLTVHLVSLVMAVRETGRAGKLTYTLTVKPASKGNVDTLLLEDQITTKEPKLERGATVFFASPDNVLSRQDPRQPELSGLRVVDHPSAGKEAASGQ